jgi:hypothetical protein
VAHPCIRSVPVSSSAVHHSFGTRPLDGHIAVRRVHAAAAGIMCFLLPSKPGSRYGSCTAMWKRVGNAPPNTLGAGKWPDAHGKALATGRTRVMVCMHRIVSKEVGAGHGLLRREDCELFSQGGTCRCHALGTCAVHYL